MDKVPYAFSAPELDPKTLYVTRANQLELEAQGLERLAYKIFGADKLASIAFAIDPIASFRASGKKVASATRTVRFPGKNTPRVLKRKTRRLSISGTQPLNTSTIYAYDRYPYSETVSSSNIAVADVHQGLINGEIIDTTRRTRPIGIDEGEFELWSPAIYAKGGQRVSHDNQITWTLTPFQWKSRVATTDISQFVGPCATLSPTSVDVVRTNMRSTLLSQMSSKTIRLLNDLNYNKRSLSLFRNVAELRDLPRMLKTSLQSLVAARKLIQAKKGSPSWNVASEYLNQKFGWELLYQDVDDLVKYPERLASKINFLMRRNGQLTTLRRSLKLEPYVYANPPSFVHYFLTGESSDSVSTEALVSTELKAVVKAVIDFPRIDSPKVRETVWFRDLGVLPTPEDVYNLVPWSWLFDWFTGLGDYVSHYDNINLDPKLIDYGFITGISTIDIRSVQVARRSTEDKTLTTPPVPAIVHSTTSLNKITREARFEGKLQIRRSISSAYGVKPAWDVGSLSAYQVSILGALGTVRAYKKP